jgi:hypothetical protein
MFNEFEVVGMSVMDCGVNIQILVKLCDGLLYGKEHCSHQELKIMASKS